MRKIQMLAATGASDPSIPAIPPEYEQRGPRELRELLTIRDMCSKLQCSRRSLYAWTKRGLIPSIQLAGLTRYHGPSVEAALLRMQREAA